MLFSRDVFLNISVSFHTLGLLQSVSFHQKILHKGTALAFSSLPYLQQLAQFLFLGRLKSLLNGSVSITNHSSIYIHSGKKKQTHRTYSTDTGSRRCDSVSHISTKANTIRAAPEKVCPRIEETSLPALARHLSDICDLALTVTEHRKVGASRVFCSLRDSVDQLLLLGSL